MKLDGGITLGETNYDEVYYDAGQTLAFAKRVDRTADDGTPDEVTVTRYLPHEDWSYYLQVTMSPNAMEGASEFFSTERIEFSGKGGSGQLYEKDVNKSSGSDARVYKYDGDKEGTSQTDHIKIDPKDR